MLVDRLSDSQVNEVRSDVAPHVGEMHYGLLYSAPYLAIQRRVSARRRS
jgi:hypothetical protein